jgi:CRISPR/Cas system CSM-associated protein Csm3 (group 7 of RAMP superfamily)
MKNSSNCCYRISATIVADSFIHLGNGKRTGVIKHSLPYIPGSVIRGSLGNCLLRIHNHKDSSELYDLLFAEEFGKSSDVFFRHCYPLHLKCSNQRNNDNVFVPSTRTLFKCQNRQCGRLYETFAPPLQCESCGKSVKPFFGYICINCGKLSTPHPVLMNRISSTAINRDSYSSEEIEETAERTQAFSNDIIINNNFHSSSSSSPSSTTITHKERHGLLHTIEVIERGTKFALDIILASSCYPLIDKLMSLLIRGLEDEGIGGSKSRGYGNVFVKDPKVEEITSEAIEKRSESIMKSSRMFSVHLLSPLVLDNTKRNVEPATVLEGARRAYSWCFKEGKPSLPEIVKLNQIFSYDVFGGWTLKEERRRRPAVSISSGSVFSFEPASGQEEEATQTQMLRKALAALEYYAIGGYKPHGYGQIKIVYD